MKTPVSSETLKQHFTYSWWKYLLVALLAFGLVDLLYTMTAYRTPNDKKIEFYVYGMVNTEKLSGYMEQVRETEMSDMEEMTPLMLLDDNNYGPMQLTTYLAAGEGDVFLLPRDQFITTAANSGLIALEEDDELMAFFSGAGVSLQSGWRKNTDTGETHLYGIPQNKLPGLEQYAYAKDGFLCVVSLSGNEENARKFLRILCRDMISVPEGEPSPAPLP